MGIEGLSDDDVSPEQVVDGLRQLLKKIAAEPEEAEVIIISINASDVRVIGLAERVIRTEMAKFP